MITTTISRNTYPSDHIYSMERLNLAYEKSKKISEKSIASKFRSIILHSSNYSPEEVMAILVMEQLF